MKRIAWFLILIVAVCTSACSNNTSENLGSFTFDKSYSYDGKYYSLQSVERDTSVNSIKISIYMSDTDELIYEFVTVRALDFWGTCWESNTYNIWIQSGDIGVICYAYKDGMWIRDSNAERPKDIISKYD